MNSTICLTAMLIGIHIVVGGWKSHVFAIQNTKAAITIPLGSHLVLVLLCYHSKITLSVTQPVRLNISTLRFQALPGLVPCNKMIHYCGQDNAGRQWSNLFTVTYE